MDQVAICNLALSRIGCKDIASLTQQSREAFACKSVYAAALSATLRGHDWSFARKPAVLALSNETHPEWLLVYRYPADCEAARRIANPCHLYECEDEKDKIPFEVGLSQTGNYQVILTNHPCATLIYTASVTNTNAFDSVFCDALAWRIAAETAQPLRGDTALAGTMGTNFLKAISGAQADSDLESKPRRESRGTFVDYRNGELGYDFRNGRE